MNILFVCSGNTCRSPMAEAILKNKLKNKNILNINVNSAGLNVGYNSKINENTILVLKEKDIIIKNFFPKQIYDKLLKDSDYIFCMTKSQEIFLKNNNKTFLNTNNIYSIGSYLQKDDIEDPYGKDIDVYRKVFYKLDEYCEEILTKIIG